MYGDGRSRFGVAACVLAGVLVLTPSIPASAGFFDFLFGGPRQSRPPEPPPPAAVDRPAPGGDYSRGERQRARSEPRISGGTGIATSYCVRLCDGRYFPIQRSSTAQAAQVCSALCPAAPTKVFFGSEIGHATARDGKQYDDLDNAFVYRQKTVDNCSCNGRSPYGLATLTPEQDPTLRAGDLIATAGGLVKATSAPSAYGKASEEDITSALRPSISEDAEEKPRVRRSNRRDYNSRHNVWQ